MRIPALILVFALWAAPSVAQQPQAGDTVLLVTRDVHVPAHSGPGVNAVAFRFASGSVAAVQATDDGTGWLRLRGERVGGGEAVGWITPRYVARTVGQVPGGGAAPTGLAWCPAPGSPDARPNRLRLATWNLNNLHAEDGGATFGGRDPSVRRFAVDYERLRCYVRLFDPDVLAVQEVDGEEALRRVVDMDVYEVHMSSRPGGRGLNGRQNTGFAYKKGLRVRVRPDVTALDVAGGSLRWGARIDVGLGAHTLALLSVHLKSGCFSDGSRGAACDELRAQVPRLEAWIDEAARGPNPLIVLGDFNRQLNQPGDTVWAALDDGEPANADLTAVTEGMPISCRDNAFRYFVDHIVADRRAAALVDRSSFRHVTYRREDRDVWDLLSDHCPVVVELSAP